MPEQVTNFSALKNYPLSVDQEPFWFLDQVRGGSPSDHVSHAFEIKGSLRIDLLEESFRVIINRHDALRTIFRDTEFGPWQFVFPDIEWKMEVIDITNLSPAVMDDNVNEICRRSFLGFSLEKGPLIRVVLIKKGEEEYILLLVMHHIIADGHSASIILSEVSETYSRQVSSKDNSCTDTPLQYEAFVAQRNRYASEQNGGDALKEFIDGTDPTDLILDLPGDHSRASVQSYTGARKPFNLSTNEFENLKENAKKRRISFFMLMAGAFFLLLQRYTNCNTILIGTPVSLRDSDELMDVVGMLVNTSVIKISASPELSVNEFFSRVRTSVIESMARQHVPIKEVVKQLNPTRDLSRNSVFQTLIQFSSRPVFELNGVTTEYYAMDPGTSQFDLSLHLFEFDSGLAGHIEYDAELFDDRRIERAVGHLKSILSSFVHLPDTTISSVNLLSPTEKQLFRDLNATEADYALDQCLHQLFEAQVDRTPDAVAVEFDGQSLSYRELEERANQLAHYLQAHSVAAEKLVGVFMERSLELVIALVGILKSGGAYVPLDPDYPAERIAFMLEDTEVPVLLTQTHLQEKLPKHNAAVVCLDQDWERIATLGEARLSQPLNSDNLAYVIYTSGSTGKPKGVMNNHCGIVNRLLWMQETYQLTAADRVLQKTPFSFDVSVWEFFWPLFTGACLVVAKPEGHKDPAYLATVIVEEKITTLHFVPSMLRLFLEYEQAVDCGTIRQVFCSGEALGKKTQDLFFERFADAALYNLYGPTEAAVDVTAWTCERGSTSSIVPIGTPIANTQCYVLDESLQPVPVGVPGELHIGGVQVARGYLNRDDLTAQQFIADPFSDSPGARLYKTGDLVRYRPSGDIEYLGRNDFQVKVRGVRIELEEIEAVLLQHGSVAQCVVIVREDRPGDQRLVAYVVLTPGAELTVTEMRQQARTQLPDYMVPQRLMEMPALPLTPNGKVDRKALPGISIAFTTGGAQLVKPESANEIYLASVWQEELGEIKLCVDDNFFDIGGHSLLAAKIVARIKSENGSEIPLRAMIVNTLGQIASTYVKQNDYPELRGSNNGLEYSNRSSQSVFAKLLRIFSKRS